MKTPMATDVPFATSKLTPNNMSDPDAKEIDFAALMASLPTVKKPVPKLENSPKTTVGDIAKSAHEEPIDGSSAMTISEDKPTRSDALMAGNRHQLRSPRDDSASINADFQAAQEERISGLASDPHFTIATVSALSTITSGMPQPAQSEPTSASELLPQNSATALSSASFELKLSTAITNDASPQLKNAVQPLIRWHSTSGVGHSTTRDLSGHTNSGLQVSNAKSSQGQESTAALALQNRNSEPPQTNVNPAEKYTNQKLPLSKLTKGGTASPYSLAITGSELSSAGRKTAFTSEPVSFNGGQTDAEKNDNHSSAIPSKSTHPSVVSSAEIASKLTTPSAGGASLTNALSGVDQVHSLIMPIEISETFSWDSARPTVTANGTISLLRADIAPHIARQLVEVMAQATHRPVEIALSPEELGRVRMSLVTDDGAITVNIITERAETLEIMRRHIDQLGQSFRAMGYETISFSFAQGGENSDQPDSEKDGSQAGTKENADVTIDQTEPNYIHIDDAPTAGVDIRL